MMKDLQTPKHTQSRGFTIKVPLWFAKKNGTPEIMIVWVVRESEKALFVEDFTYRRLWIPKSIITTPGEGKL